MATVSLLELIDTIAGNRAAADKIVNDWPPTKVMQLVDRLDAMLTGAGVPGGDVEELTSALRSWLLSVNEDAAGIQKNAGAAEHCLEKARRKIRAAADAPAGFKFD
jgi:hypothetical protein